LETVVFREKSGLLHPPRHACFVYLFLERSAWGVAVDGERLPTAAVGSCVAGMSQSGKSGGQFAKIDRGT